jgi:hypothetical protein
MRKDDILINKVIEEAGLLSRASARLKALGGAAKQAASDVGTAISGKKPSQDAGWRGKYTQGKQEQILKTLSNDIIKDLTKLKLVPTGSPLNPVDLQNTLTQYISKYTGVGDQKQEQSEQNTNQPSPESSFAPSQSETETETETVQSTQSVTPTPAQPAQPEQQTSSTSTQQPTTINTPQPAVNEEPEQDVSTTQETPKQEETPQQQIPLGSTITDTKGKIYRYSSPEEVAQDNKLTPNPNANPENAMWYVLSKPNKKTGQSSMAFSTDVEDPNIQSAISSAWQKKSTKEQEEMKQANTPTFESFKNYFWK